MFRITSTFLPLTLVVSAAVHAVAAEPVQILCLGDSITRGVRSGVASAQTFEVRLQEMLSEHVLPVTVINSGIGGERTDQAIKRLSRDVIARRPDIVCIMYGTNDSAIDEGKSSPRLPVTQYRENLERMVDRLRAADIEPILMTPIPLCTSFVYMTRSPYKEHGPNHMLIDYVRTVRQVALAKAVPLVDHFAAWSERALLGVDLNTLTTDGCHPNPDGHRLIAETLYPMLAVTLGGAPALPQQEADVPRRQAEQTEAGTRNLALRCGYEESAPNHFGYGAGLTDGIRDRDSKPGVYATDGEANYPKTTTIDLGETHDLTRVVVHNSTDGSTKTVAVSLSQDGEAFTELGKHRFECGDGASVTFEAEAQPARYVRVMFLDTWGNTTHGSPDFMFLREVEVFGR